MSTLKSKAAKAASVASLALFMVTGAATVAQAAPTRGGAEVTGDVSIAACESAGGGTWCHGTQPSGLLQECYSNYIHNSNYHSATAAAAGANSKRYASAGFWANASVTSGWAYTCYTYWDNDA